MFRLKLLTSLKTYLLCLYLFVGGAAVPVAPSTPQPEWVRGGTHARFNRVTHLTAVGSGNSRHAAERDALGRLVAIFGQSIHFDERTTELYWGIMGSGVATTWSERVDIEGYFERQAGMDSLVGAEIGDFWDDGRGTSFALAVLNKAMATRVYSGRIRANQEVIGNLTNTALIGERNTFNGFARYQLAAVFADMNIGYGEILSVIGAPQYARGLRSGDDFRREAQEIRGAIPIGINVRNDRGGRIHDAFAGAFSDLGFRIGGTGSSYVLDVDISVTLDQRFSAHHDAWLTWAYKTLRAELRDARTGTVLLPYTVREREGHVNRTWAEDWVFRRAVETIGREYGNLLADYLAGLVPGR